MEIELHNVRKMYGKKVALDGLNFRLEPGTVGAVIGLNGAGKTTLLRLLGGVLVPNEGEVLFDGNAFNRADLDFRRRLFFLPEVLPTLFGFSAFRQASMVFNLYGRKLEAEKEALMDLYERLDMLPYADSPLGKLSRGQIYKAVLAPYLMLAPELWLVDEPFAAGMDPEGMMVFRSCARKAAERGSTVLFTTQILEIAEDFADVIYILHHGKLVEILPVADLKASVGEGQVSGEVVRLLGKLRGRGREV
jgi:ABC-type multidrug transport system ATPase subunit